MAFLKKRARKRELQAGIAELRQLTERLPDADGVIAPEGLREFLEFADSHNIALDTVPDLRTAVRLGLAEGGRFIATDTTLLLKKDESPLLDAPVDLLKEVADREFRAGTRGLSIPMGHGVRYHTSATRGHM